MSHLMITKSVFKEAAFDGAQNRKTGSGFHESRPPVLLR